MCAEPCFSGSGWTSACYWEAANAFALPASTAFALPVKLLLSWLNPQALPLLPFQFFPHYQLGCISKQLGGAELSCLVGVKPNHHWKGSFQRRKVLILMRAIQNSCTFCISHFTHTHPKYQKEEGKCLTVLPGLSTHIQIFHEQVLISLKSRQMHSYGHSNDIKETMRSEYIPFLRDFITYLRRKKKRSKSAFLLAASAEKPVFDLLKDWWNLISSDSVILWLENKVKFKSCCLVSAPHLSSRVRGTGIKHQLRMQPRCTSKGDQNTYTECKSYHSHSSV